MGSARYPIGVSSYHDGTSTTPRNKMQFLASAGAALQVRSAAAEFDRDVLKNNGEHLTPNEGIRELPRQQELFDLHVKDPAHWALAATPGYSTHGPQIGTAVDFGITRADGSNRALTAAEWPKLYAILAKRGWVHTGAGFRVYEAWHCNGGYTPVALAPITGVPLMGGGTITSSSTKPSKGRKQMYIIHSPKGHTLVTDKGTYKFAAFTIGSGKNKQTYLGSQQVQLMERVITSNQSGMLTGKSAEFLDIEVAIIATIIGKVK